MKNNNKINNKSMDHLYKEEKKSKKGNNTKKG